VLSIDDQISVGINAGIETFGLAIRGDQRRVTRHVDGQDLAVDADRLAHLKVQVRGRAVGVLVHVAGHAPENVALLHLVALFHGDRLGVHVQVPILGPVGTPEPNRGVRRHQGNDAVRDSDGFPLVVLACGRTDILPLVSLTARAHRHRPGADLAIGVVLVQRVVVDRVALGAAGLSLAIPAAAAVPPDLGIQVRMLIGGEPQWKDDVRQVHLAVALAAACGIVRVQNPGRIIGEGHTEGWRIAARARLRRGAGPGLRFVSGGGLRRSRVR